jgi:hypothetical protein
MTNTEMNIGIRRNFTTLGDRNYEPLGGAQYESATEDLEYLGTKYDSGVTIPFDAGGPPADRYSDDALMERYFNAGLITPLT